MIIGRIFSSPKLAMLLLLVVIIEIYFVFVYEYKPLYMKKYDITYNHPEIESDLIINDRKFKISEKMKLISYEKNTHQKQISMGILKGDNNMLLISGIDNKVDWSKTQAIAQKFFRRTGSTAYEMKFYRLTFGDDTAWCYKHHGYHLIIPDRKLYLNYYDNTGLIDNAVELIREIVYQNSFEFEWEKSELSVDDLQNM